MTPTAGDRGGSLFGPTVRWVFYCLHLVAVESRLETSAIPDFDSNWIAGDARPDKPGRNISPAISVFVASAARANARAVSTEARKEGSNG
jgi:hypothetical protein